MTKLKRLPRWSGLAAVGLMMLCANANAAIIHVDDSAPPQGDGSSWDLAFRSLRKALNQTQGGDEIRIAQGTYRPTKPNGKRKLTFLIGYGLLVQGGYAGVGALDPDELNPSQFPTILSGDLNGNDVGKFNNNEENSYNVVTIGQAELRGVTIQRGNANHPASDPNPRSHGGGVHCLDAPVLVDCTLRWNQSAKSGGAFWCESDTPTLINCIIRDNFVISSMYGGAGVKVESGNFINCTFRRNRIPVSLNYGGGISAWGPVLVDHCTFENNSTCAINCDGDSTIRSSTFFSNHGDDGGAIYISGFNVAVIDSLFHENAAGHGGAIIVGSFASASIVNCAFFGNRASDTGHALTARSSTQVVNCLFSGNGDDSPGDHVAAIQCTGEELIEFINCTVTGNNVNPAIHPAAGIRGNGNTILRNCIIWGNETTQPNPDDTSQISGMVLIEDCCIEHWTGSLPGAGAGAGNFDADPLFIDRDGPDDILGTPDDNCRLAGGSLCVDAGDNAALPSDVFDLDEDGDTAEHIPVDLDFEERISGPAVDLGPYEF